ncbi:hypothetical protein F4804DRAFT_138794 [Jackrogersella minutella]|nr:hypothetical protein F4804DRAFT_138794 [Jackrogersella minutella]
MSGSHTSVVQRADCPASDETQDVMSSQKSPTRMKAFFRCLRSRLKPHSLSKLKPKKSSSKEKRSTKSTSQQSSAEGTRASRERGLSNQIASTSRQSAASILSSNYNNSPYSRTSRNGPSPALYHGTTRTYGLNDMKRLSGTNISSSSTSNFSPKPISNRRRISWHDTNLSRTSLPNGSRPASISGSFRAVAQENHKPEEETTHIDERERTLRILESRDRPVVARRSCSPATIQRRRQSYQLATDPRIDPQQYSDFRSFLEKEFATNLALRLQVLESLTKDLGNRVGLVIGPESAERAPVTEDAYSTNEHARTNQSSYRQSHELGSHGIKRPESCPDIDYISRRRNGNLKRRSWIEHEEPENQKLNSRLSGYYARFRDDHTSIRGSNKINRRWSSAIHPGFDHSSDTDPNEKVAAERSHAWKRQSWSHQGAPRRSSLERRRKSISSFTQVVAQYIKPEMPTTIYYRETNYGSS